MIEKRELHGNIKKAMFGFGGTEFIENKKLMELTGNKHVEITAEGEGVKIVLNLIAKPKDKIFLIGSFYIYEKRHVDTDERI